MKNKKSFIPGFFTALNIFCGFLAIIKISEDNIITACWLIVFAAIFDGLDGQLARFIKSPSNFGVEFDSLADIVSFGVAPSFLLYDIYFQKFGILGIIMSFSPLVFGGVRLARFNIQLTGFEKLNFSGLPIPIAAISFVSYVIFNYNFWNEIFLTRILGPHLVCVCILMVSTVEYYTFPKLTFRAGRKHSSIIIIMLVGFIILILFPHETLYPISIAYILWGVIRFFYRVLRIDTEEAEK
ncbi:MAG: CDP-diacylglycerol--serine O-phosphatidyltransferase [Candidatus Hodarchaeota archaeon]